MSDAELNTDEVQYGWESVEEIFARPGVYDLILSQWKELSHLPDHPLSPRFADMLHAERRGSYKIWAAHNYEIIVGFIQFQIIAPYAYTDILFACDCGWYLDPELRSPWIAARMWRSAEAALKELGVKIIRGHDNEKRPLAPFFRRIGYQPVSTMYEKAL